MQHNIFHSMFDMFTYVNKGKLFLCMTHAVLHVDDSHKSWLSGFHENMFLIPKNMFSIISFSFVVPEPSVYLKQKSVQNMGWFVVNKCRLGETSGCLNITHFNEMQWVFMCVHLSMFHVMFC